MYAVSFQLPRLVVTILAMICCGMRVYCSIERVANYDDSEVITDEPPIERDPSSSLFTDLEKHLEKEKDKLCVKQWNIIKPAIHEIAKETTTLIFTPCSSDNLASEKSDSALVNIIRNLEIFSKN